MRADFFKLLRVSIERLEKREPIKDEEMLAIWGRLDADGRELVNKILKDINDFDQLQSSIWRKLE